MGQCLSQSADVIVPTVDYINHFNELRFKFPCISNRDDFKKYILHEIVYPNQYKLIKDYLKFEKFIDDDDMLTTKLRPFNLYSRIVTGAVPNNVNQESLGHYQHDFLICLNKPENDEKWNIEAFGDAAMSGPDDTGPGHVFMTTRNLHWTFFNILSITMNGQVSFLEDMKRAAELYVENRGWFNVGYYFNCFPYNNENSLQLHIVNLDNTGFNYRKLRYKNLPIDDAIEVAKYVRSLNRVRCCR